MYITAVPNRHSPPAILLRESFRDGDKVRSTCSHGAGHAAADGVGAVPAVVISL